VVQCVLLQPREPVPVGDGQTRRSWVVTAEVRWSRVIAGARAKTIPSLDMRRPA
jgi:hypothetical protein